MDLIARFEAVHAKAKANKWMGYFAVFNRIALAAGFIPSGFTKILGERFTSLSANHPMGNYLEALYHTGYYYTFIGYAQVLAALLLLIPRTATLVAVLYFPIILNICLLSLSVGFDGSLVSSPLMLLGNFYLLCWDYDKLRYILPTRSNAQRFKPQYHSTKFPIRFFLGVVVTVLITGFIVTNSYQKKTRNTLEDCVQDCKNSDFTQPCLDFCDCIHQQGKSFNHCAEALRKAKEAP